ncbi:oxidoreductase [Mycobacteroides abscessus subsp. abscessus]|nr:oxidoreductase [Mycobacteroides abscessus subsp. abscessus]
MIAARAEGRSLDGERYLATADHAAVPQVVFTEPQVGSVGLTERGARDAGIDVVTSELDIEVAGSALARENYRGHAVLVIDRARNVLVGATFVGPDIAELVHSATVAVVGEVPVERLWHAVPSYPTISEIWLRLLENLRGKQS